jgi:hypothetical protein
MYEEGIAGSVDYSVEVVVELPFIRVLVCINEPIAPHIIEDIGNMVDEVIIDFLHSLGHSTKIHGKVRIGCQELLQVGTDLEGGRERAQDWDIVAIVGDVTILDFQSLHIVQTNSSYLKVFERDTRDFNILILVPVDAMM